MASRPWTRVGVQGCKCRRAGGQGPGTAPPCRQPARWGAGAYFSAPFPPLLISMHRAAARAVEAAPGHPRWLCTSLCGACPWSGAWPRRVSPAATSVGRNLGARVRPALTGPRHPGDAPRTCVCCSEAEAQTAGAGPPRGGVTSDGSDGGWVGGAWLHAAAREWPLSLDPSEPAGTQ